MPILAMSYIRFPLFWVAIICVLFAGSSISFVQAQTPGKILQIGPDNVNHFELQIPVKKPDGTITITQKSISKGYTSEWFFVDPNTSPNTVVFFVPVSGDAITIGSFFPRCELRQVNPDGTKAGFNAWQGIHQLQGHTQITHLPGTKPEVVIAQLINNDKPVVQIRTFLISTSQIDPTPVIALVVYINGKKVANLAKPYTTNPSAGGFPFYWAIVVNRGKISIFYDPINPITSSSQLVYTSTSDQSAGWPSDNTWYFKAGCYPQTNTNIDSPSDYTSITLNDLLYYEAG